MKNASDKQTFKLKKRLKKKDKDSNSSKDSLELEMKSYRQNKKSQKKTAEGEEIKFFFNDLPIYKKASTLSNRRLNLNISKKKGEFDFKEILINYVNQTGRTNDQKSIKKEKDSIIFSKSKEILTLNGEDNETNKEEFSSPIIESNSESPVSESLSSDKNIGKEEKIKKIKIKEKINKKIIKNNNNIENNETDYNKKQKTILKKSKIVEKKNYINNNDNKEKKDKKDKKDKKVTILSDKKLKKSDSCINSNYNKLSNSYKIINSNKNTFTTATNTFKTQNTLNSSFKSLQANLKKYNYDYLNSSDLSLQKKLLIQNRIISGKKIINNEEEKINIKLIKNERNPFNKIKNIDISLDTEKSYSNYFRYIINLQNQKNNYKKITNNNNLDNESKNTQQSYSRYFYYPEKYYIDKNSNLHSKIHISNIFSKLRKKI